LKEPRVVSKLDGGAAYDFRKRETLVSESYVEDLSKISGLPIEKCLIGIFSHEIGHYMVFPKTLGTLILAAKMIDDFFNKQPEDVKTFILQTYADMVNDTASVLEEQRTGAILAVRSVAQATIEDKLNKNIRAVMLAFLNYQAGRKPELDEELKPYLERMLEIDFLKDNVESMRQGIWKFGNIIIEMIEKYKDGKAKLKEDWHLDCDIKAILRKATPQEVREALREISYKISRREYEKVKEWIEKNGGNLASVSESRQRTGIGTSNGELTVDQEVIDYYIQLSQHYPLVITKKLLPTHTNIRAWSNVEKWRPGSDHLLVLPNTSGGLLLPGITKKIRVTERPIKSRDYKIPHLLVVIDSSGSMPDPKESKSYAVLGAYCAARSYHLHGSYLGVINFSGSSFYLPYTRDLMQALGAISAYQGGGTTVDLEMLKKMLGPEMEDLYRSMPELDMRRLPKEVIRKDIELPMQDFEEAFTAESVDLLMFTDGGISNLDEVLEFFSERAQLNRATIILVHGFAQDIGEEYGDRIRIEKVESEKDIPNICIKAVNRHLNAFAEVIEHA
jgi:hypothetical protein